MTRREAAQHLSDAWHNVRVAHSKVAEVDREQGRNLEEVKRLLLAAIDRLAEGGWEDEA